MARNNLTENEALQRIGSQMSLEEKSKRATHVVDNSHSIAETDSQIKELYQTFERSRAYWKLRIIVFSCLATVVALISHLLK